MALSSPANAILSCNAVAGPSGGGGAGDNCNPLTDKLEALALDPGRGFASVSAINGSMSGEIAVSTSTISDGTFGGNLTADFRILGPAGGASAPARILFSVGGSIAADCTSCEANIGYSQQIDSVSFAGFRMRISAGRTIGSDWAVTSSQFNTSGFDLAPTVVTSSPTAGSLTFDAASVVGHTFRLTASFSGNAHLTGPNAPGSSLIVDAGDTALFNVLLPAGYSFAAVPFNPEFLSAPSLVPEPSVVALFALSVPLVLVAAARRRRTRTS
jgi:hypothetical protein